MSAILRNAARMPQTIEVLTSDARLAAVAPAWEALCRRVNGLPFQDPAWILAWRRTDPKRAQRSLRIGLLWNGAALDAVLPFAITQRGVRLLEWAAKDHSDYCDVLAAPDCPSETLDALWRETLAGGFDVAYLNRLLPDAAAKILAERGAGAVPLAPNNRSEQNFRVFGTWATGDAWFESQSKKTRQNYRRGCKALESSGSLRFRLLGPGDPLQPVLDRVASLKRQWLASRGIGSEVFDGTAPALPDLVSALERRGILHVFVLECGDTIVAASINFVHEHRMMAFVTTYDPAFERASPGMVLMMDYIRWSFDRGLTEVDFLVGDEEFKRRFATRSLELSSLAGARTPVGRLALTADRLRQSITGLRDRTAAARE